MKRLEIAVTLSCMLLSINSCGRRSDSEYITIIGSDTMVNLVQAWSEEFMKTHPEASIAVTGGGSGTGIASLISGTCSIAAASRNLKPEEMETAKKNNVNPVEYTVALDGIAVVAHPTNPVSKLTLEQLADIFTGKITSWKELGGSDKQILLLSREVNSGTHIYFKEHVLRKNNPDSPEEFAPGALMLSSSQAIADEITGNPQAIGYYGMGYINQNQKIVEIGRTAEAPYYQPTIETVVAGTYPISRPLFLYVNGEPQGPIKAFIDFILSPQGQEIVQKIDFVPIK